MDKVLIIIPTYNESESILQLLARIVLVSKTLESKYKIDILIVDDNSPDLTFKKVEELKLKFKDQLFLLKRLKVMLEFSFSAASTY